MTTKELLEEINYLTGLIQSHKTSNPRQSTSHHSHPRRNKREKYKWTGTCSSSAPVPPATSAPPPAGYSREQQQQQLRERTKHGNLVYKPGHHQSRPLPQAHPPSSSTASHHSAPTTLAQTAVQVPPTSSPSGGAGKATRKRSLSRIGDNSTLSKKHKRALPSRSQLKWKRKSLESPATSPAPFSADTGDTSQPHRTMTVKRPLTPANSRFRWKRRLSSGSKKARSRLLSSNLVVQSSYKLTRASLLRKSPRSPFLRRPASSSRRLRRTSLTVHSARKRNSRTPVRPAKYRNKVWVASIAKPSDQDTATDSDAPSRLAGHESKTRRGNKQWVASHRAAVSRATSTRTRLSSTGAAGGGVLGVKVVSLRDAKFAVDASGRKLRRLRSSSSELLLLHPPHSPRPSFTRILASQAVRRSKVYVWQAKQRSRQQQVDKSKQYCMFFNRFGKCKHMDTTCPYIHDPDKIAVCTKFLKGVCDRVDGTCPFSHKIAKEKMPVCSFFLRGVCSRDSCPYLHVSVGRDADVCMQFARGYCPRGDQCTKQHTLDCPEYQRSGSCSKGRACPLRHHKRAHQRPSKAPTDSKTNKPVQESGPLEEPKAFRRLRKWREFTTAAAAATAAGRRSEDCRPDAAGGGAVTGELEFIPLEQKHTHDFIAL